MNEQMKSELLELSNLESAGTLQDSQKPQLDLLRAFEQADKTAKAEADKMKKDFDSAMAQKDHFRSKAEKEEAARIAAEQKLGGSGDGKSGLDVGDYIDISASLEGLDKREKEFLASQHKMTGKPLQEIRNDENFLLWQTAYKQKVEKEKTLVPDGTQPDANEDKSFDEQLESATSIAEKQEILEKAGLYHEDRPRSDKVVIMR